MSGENHFMSSNNLVGIHIDPEFHLWGQSLHEFHFGGRHIDLEFHFRGTFPEFSFCMGFGVSGGESVEQTTKHFRSAMLGQTFPLCEDE